MPRILAPLMALALIGSATVLNAMTVNAADPGLQDVRWKLVSIRGVPAEKGRRDSFLQFKPDGGLSGNTGCNNLGSVYTIDGDRLAFGPIATTRMYCREVANTERELLRNLPDVGSFTLVDGRLELMTDSGVTLAIFEPMDD